MQLPGVSNIWTMPIINRIDMLTTGIRSEVGVKVFGTDLTQLERLARQVADALRDGARREQRLSGAGDERPVPQHRDRSRRRCALRHRRRRRPAGDRNGRSARRSLTTTIEGRAAISGARALRAGVSRRRRRRLAQVLVAAPGRRADSARPARAHRARARAGDDLVGERPAARDGAAERPGARRRRLRGRGARHGGAGRVACLPGYYIGVERAVGEPGARTAAAAVVVLPIVLLVIFVLLYFTYRSAVEAAHVLLAVPFALTGGVYLLWLLGYNFSVAVWVGFIALFGTAVQTGVVMVIYLEEAVQRKRQELGGTLTRASLRDAVIEGALLRLRPKVMTVSTVVAGLLPIMWSTRVGAEVMKPLATPVLGGMVSSLLHVLIVTPVIFFWIHERRLGLQHEALPAREGRSRPERRVVLMAVVATTIVTLASLTWWFLNGSDTDTGSPSSEAVVQTVRSGDLAIVLRSPTGTLRGGRNTFTFEFRSASGALVDVGTVHATANMTMPGMAMSGNLQVRPTGERGLYAATAEFGMAGSWQMSVEWSGPAGSGSVNFQGAVQ